MPAQLTRSMPTRRSAGVGATAFEDLGGLDGFDDERWLNRHQSALLPRVSASWSSGDDDGDEEEDVALAIW